MKSQKTITSIFLACTLAVLVNFALATDKKLIKLTSTQETSLNFFVDNSAINQDISKEDYNLRAVYDGRALLSGKTYPQYLKVDIYTLDHGEKELHAVVNRTIRRRKNAQNIRFNVELPRIQKTTDIHIDIYDSLNRLNSSFVYEAKITGNEVKAELADVPQNNCSTHDTQCLVENLFENVSFTVGQEAKQTTKITKNTQGAYNIQIPVNFKKSSAKNVVEVTELIKTKNKAGNSTVDFFDGYPFFENQIEVARAAWNDFRDSVSLTYEDSDKAFHFLKDGSLQLSTDVNNAYLNIAAGTNEKAPMIFSPGDLLDLPTEGAFEYDGRDLYFTNARRRVKISEPGPPGPPGPRGPPGDPGSASATATDLSNGGILNGTVQFINFAVLEDAQFNGNFLYNQGAANGYVLTSDANGYASWQAASAIFNGSEWTDLGSIMHPSETTDDVAIGGTNSSAPIFMDASTGIVSSQGFRNKVANSGIGFGMAPPASYNEIQSAGNVVLRPNSTDRVLLKGSDATSAASLAFGDLGNNVIHQFNSDDVNGLVLDWTSNSNKGLVVKAPAGQTANLQEWQNGAGQVQAYIDNGGNLVQADWEFVNSKDPNGINTLLANNTGITSLDSGATESLGLFAGGSLVAQVIQRNAPDQGLAVDGYIGFKNSTGYESIQPDVRMYKGGADILEHRRGFNAQEVRIYNTYNGTTDFERTAFAWDNNEFKILSENGSAGGTKRNISISAPLTTINGSLAITDGTEANGYVLTSDANGNGSWQDVETLFNGVMASGAAGAVQFSDGAGHLSSDATNFSWNNSSNGLEVSALVLNEDGLGINPLRVETSTNTHALYVQNLGSRIGINTNSLSADLNVGGTRILAFSGGAGSTQNHNTIQTTSSGADRLTINAGEVYMGGGVGSSKLSIIPQSNGHVALGLRQRSGGLDTMISIQNGSGVETMGLTTAGLIQISPTNGNSRFDLDNRMAPASSDGDGIGINFRVENASGSPADIAYIDTVFDDISTNEVSLRFSVRDSVSDPVERMRLDYNGNLGIGFTAPSSKLSVNGSVQIVDGTEANGYVLTSDANGNGSWQDVETLFNGVMAAGAAGAVQFSDGAGHLSSDATNFFWDDTNNRLGIGTDSPEYLLTINGNAGASDGISIANLGTATVGLDMRDAGLSGTSDYYMRLGSGAYWRADGALSIPSGQTIKFQGSEALYGHTGLGEVRVAEHNNFKTLKLYSNGNVVQTIDVNGSVGIGFESPSSKLSVNGSVQIVDGTEANGYVLTSNASGVASWQAASGDIEAVGDCTSGTCNTFSLTGGVTAASYTTTAATYSKSTLTSSGFYSGPDAGFFFGNTTWPTSGVTTGFVFDSAHFANPGSIAMRHGTNKQSFRIYNTYTSAIDYERAIFDWQKDSNVFTIGTQNGSAGGTLRDINFIGGNIGVANTNPGAKLDISINDPAEQGLILRADSSQTENIFEWYDSSGSKDGYIDRLGKVYISANHSGNPSLTVNGVSNWFSAEFDRGITDDQNSGKTYYFTSGNAHQFGRSVIYESSTMYFDGALPVTQYAYRVRNNGGDYDVERLKNGATLNTPLSIASNNSITINGDLTIDDGTQSNGYVLTSNAAGNASWQDVSVLVNGVSASGAAGALQFSDGSGDLNADATNLFWDDSNNRLGIGTDTPAAALQVNGFALIGNPGTQTMAIGRGAGEYNNGLNNNLIGYEVNALNSTNYVNAMGQQAAYNNNGDEINAIGFQTAYNNISNTVDAYGYQAAYANTGTRVIALGRGSSYNNNGDDTVTIGFEAGQSNKASNVNAIGYRAAGNNNGENLVAIGLNAAYLNNGDHVVALQRGAGYYNNGDNAILIGRAAGNKNEGHQSIALGYYAARENKGNNLIALGDSSASYNSGAASVAIGRNTLYKSNGDFNIAIGYEAGELVNNGAENILIGHGVELQDNNGSYELNIGNTIYGDLNNGEIALGAAKNNPDATLDLTGSFKYVDGNQANGYVLTSNGSGVATWQPVSNASGSFTNDQGQTGSEAFGNGATLGAARSTVFGNNAQAIGSAYDSVVIGYNANGNVNAFESVVIGADAASSLQEVVVIGHQTVVGAAGGVVIGDQADGRAGVTIGKGAHSDNTSGIAIGPNSNLGGNSYVAIGSAASGTGSYAVAIGPGSTVAHARGFAVMGNTTANSQVVFGGSNPSLFYYEDVYIGSGVTNATPRDTTYHATGGSGTDIAGANLIFAAGIPTGSGTGGDLIFQTSNGGSSSTAARDLHERMRITENGAVVLSKSLVLDTIVANTSGTSINIDWTAGNKQTITLAHNVTTVTFTDPPGTASFVLVVKQDATGSRTVTGWPAAVKWAGGVAPTFSTTANAIDVVSCLYDGTDYLCNAGLDFQ